MLDTVIDSFYTNRKGGSSVPGEDDGKPNRKSRRKNRKKVSVEIPDEIPLDVMEKVGEMREPLRMLISKGAPDIHDLPARQQGREFLVWKALFLESRSKGIPDECIFSLLRRHQPKFDLHHTVYQLQYLHGLKPFKNETLERLIRGRRSETHE